MTNGAWIRLMKLIGATILIILLPLGAAYFIPFSPDEESLGLWYSWVCGALAILVGTLLLCAAVGIGILIVLSAYELLLAGIKWVKTGEWDNPFSS